MEDRALESMRALWGASYDITPATDGYQATPRFGALPRAVLTAATAQELCEKMRAGYPGGTRADLSST